MPRFSLTAALPISLFLGIGCMLAYFGIVQGINTQAKQKWPKTEAVVLESEAIFLDDGDPEIKMHVEYSVQQAQYKTYVYAYNELRTDHIPPRYAVEQKVEVYYDPIEPSNAIYHLPKLMTSIIVVLISLIPISVAMLFIVFWLATGYTNWKMYKARRYLRRAEKDIAELDQYLKQQKSEGRTVSSELLAEHDQLVEQAEGVQKILNILQQKTDGLYSPTVEQEIKKEEENP